MHYKDIKGMRISQYTLGTVQLGIDYGIANKAGKPGIEKSFSILQTAEELGINAYDTSEAYGDSENILGKYFTEKSDKTNQPLIITKVRAKPGDEAEGADLEKNITSYVEASLERLNLKRIPILLLHNPNDLYTFGKRMADVMERLVTRGYIEKAGASVYTTEDVEEMLKYDIYEAIQVPMNIFDHRLIKSGALKKLIDKNTIIFVRSIFLQGLFFLNPEELQGKLVKAKEPLVKLRQFADKAGLNIAQLALSYIRDMEGITSLVIGAETPEQVRENAKLMETPRLDPDLVEEIERTFTDIPVEILNPSLWK
ncbi:MAG TPA: aldo/keto reductase [Clostridiaceae bacterium]|nr:aldo/keto reductase [Clostridiaceae bacterium]